jgi:hypothetical protein
MGFRIFKLNNLKTIYDLYSQCLTQNLFKTICFTDMKRVSLSTIIMNDD